MALGRWQATIVDDSGNIVPFAFIEVRREIPGQPLVRVYSDRDGLVALGNPFQADAEGFSAFHVVGGAYKIRAYVNSPAFERVWRYVAHGTAQEFDVEELSGDLVANYRLEVQSFWPQYVVETIAERAAYDAGPVFDDQGRRLSVLVTADETNTDGGSPPQPLPTLYFLLSNDSPAVWSQGFTFPVMVPELADGVFTGDGVTTVFDLEVMVQDARYVDWYEDGIPQRAGIDFTTLGTFLTRTTAPADGAIIWWKRVVVNDITGLGAALDAKEDVANKSTDGTLAANSDTLYPSQKAVKTAIAAEATARDAAITAAVVGLFDDRGNYDASVNTFPASGGSGAAGAILKGDIWTVSIAGTLGGTAVGIGDTVRAIVNTPGQTAGNWAVGETNIGFVPENVANKDTDGTLAANSAAKYPAQSAVVTYVTAAVAAGLAAIRDGVAAGYDTLAEIATDLGLKMVKTANLADVASVPTARVNLNIDAKTTHGDSAYTILATDRWLTTSAALTAPRVWTLPAANTLNPGQTLVVSDATTGGVTATNKITITRAGSDTINGGTTFDLDIARGVVILHSDGVSAWGARIVVPFGTSAGQAVRLDSAAKLPAVDGSQLTNLPGAGAGTTTNDNAAAGNIGEYVSALVNSASAVSRSNGATANITGVSISLTAGDWDVSAIAEFFAANTTTVQYLEASISQISNTRDLTTGNVMRLPFPGASGSVIYGAGGYFGPTLSIPSVRISLASPATINLVTYQEFSVSALSAYGSIHARRIR